MATIVKRVVKDKDIALAPSVKKEKQIFIYLDKSAGQPNIVSVFDELRTMLLQFVKGALMIHGDGNGQLHICSKKDMEVLGKKRGEIHFADLLVQKGFVGFYFSPVYTDEVLKKELAPELLKCLKGKSCFHIKRLDSLLKGGVLDALEKGYDLYERKGWV